MIKATKIRIYPDHQQEESLAKAFGCARFVWNNSLAEIQKTYQETGKGLGQFALTNRLPFLKQEFEWLKEPYSQVLQSVCLNLSRAFVNFFEKRAEYPKFKSKQGKQSIQYPQYVKIVGGCKIHLPKIGQVKAVIHREIAGTIKTVTVSKTPTGKYFASILTEDGTIEPSISFEGKAIGIDVGLSHLAATSDGSKYDNPRNLKKHEKNLTRKQKKLSRKTIGSNTQKKAKLLVAKVHERIKNSRNDNLHKLSHKIVDENQVIAVEHLNVKGMTKNHNLSKAINDAGWSGLIRMLEYKAHKKGKAFIRVNRFFPSSKTCSSCLNTQKSMPLHVRTWKCGKCGTVHDRDVNAAKNIRDEALRMIAAGTAGTASGGTVSQGRGRKPSVLAGAVEAGSHCF